MTAIVSLIVGLSVLTPIGWSRIEPEYSVRVGETLRIRPLADDVRRARAVVRLHADPAYFVAEHGSYTTMPPGLRVEPDTGAISGSPTIPGTYRVAIGLSDGRGSTAVGPTFRVKVLPDR